MGFLNFGITDNDIVYQCTLTTNEVNAQGSATYSSQDTGYTFSATGVDVGALKGLRYTIDTADADAMEAGGGHLQFEVDSLYFTNGGTPDKTRYAWSFTNGQYCDKAIDNDVRHGFDSSAGSRLPDMQISPIGKSAIVPAHWNWSATVGEFYVDYLQVKRVTDRTNVDGENYSTLYIGGLTTVADVGPSGQDIRNAQLVKRAITFDTSALASVGLLGTSFYTQGAPAAWTTASGNTLSWQCGFGYDTDGTTALTAGSWNNDAGFCCTLFRELSRAGYNPDTNVNRAQSGGKATHLSTQLDNMTITDGITPDLLILNVGTNEATSLDSAATFETNIKAIVTKAETKGIANLLVQECLSLSNDPAYNLTVYENLVDDYNVAINGLAAWASAQGYAINISVDPCFAAFGGHSPTAAWFQTNNVHPNETGSYQLGLQAATAAQALLLTPGSSGNAGNGSIIGSIMTEITP